MVNAPEGGVLAQRSFGLDMRSFVLFGLLLGAPSGVWVPETVHTARDLLRRRGSGSAA